MSVRLTLLLGLPLTLVAAAPFGYSLTTQRKAPPAPEEKLVDQRKVGEKLCASRIVNERLKARVFDDAAVVGAGMSANLDLLASFSEVRMEQPLLKSRDEGMGVTVCTGRFVLLLPPGAERGFGGMRLLSADVEYAALPAADGSGLVYQLRGADPIVYRLAAFNLRARRMPEDVQLAAAEAPTEPVAEPVPVPIASPSPLPQAPKLAKAPEPLAEKPVQVANAAPKPARAEQKQAEPKLAKSEPKKAPPPKAKLAKAEPKLASKTQTAEAKKPAPATKKTSVAQAKRKPAKEEKLAAAAPKKAVPTKPVVKTPKLAAVAPAKAVAKVAANPKPQILAAAKPKAPAPVKEAPVATGNTENSFLNYEKRKAAAAAKPVETAAEEKPSRPAPVAAVQPRRDACADADGVEARLVCANPGLAAKQRNVANTYYAALRDAEGEARRALTGSRNRFASYVSRCSSASCLAGAYDDRVAEIRDIMADY